MCGNVFWTKWFKKFGLNIEVNKVDELYYLQCAKHIRIGGI